MMEATERRGVDKRASNVTLNPYGSMVVYHDIRDSGPQ